MLQVELEERSISSGARRGNLPAKTVPKLPWHVLRAYRGRGIRFAGGLSKALGRHPQACCRFGGADKIPGKSRDSANSAQPEIHFCRERGTLRFNRSSRNSAAGVSGSSPRRTTTIGGARNVSLTGIAANMLAIGENLVHCTGTMVRRSLFASVTISVSADWLRSIRRGGGRLCCSNSSRNSSSALNVTDDAAHSAPARS